MSKENKKAGKGKSKVVEETNEPPSAHPFSVSTTSVNKYDPYSLKAAIDEEIVEVSHS